MILDFKKGIDYFIENEPVLVNPTTEKKGSKCKCPRELLFGEQIQIVEKDLERKAK